MRKTRYLIQGALYHVTARANRKELVLQPSQIKVLFLEVLSRARRRFKFTLDNFCIMGNHIHLLIRPGKECSLSRLMQWVLSVFARAYNRLHGLVGHVWGERFFSVIVAGFRSFLEAFNYIDENPVAAGLVNREAEWPFCGLWHHRTGDTSIADPPGDHVLLQLPCHAQRLLAEP